jgi:hypothetical protein
MPVASLAAPAVLRLAFWHDACAAGATSAGHTATALAEKSGGVWWDYSQREQYVGIDALLASGDYQSDVGTPRGIIELKTAHGL